MKHSLLSGLLLCLLAIFAASPAAAVKPLRISIFPFSPPFSFYAVRDGNRYLQGYTIDECLAVGKKLGRPVEFVPTSSLKRQAPSLKKGELACIAHDSDSYAQRHSLEFLPIGVSLQHYLYVHTSCRPGIHLDKAETFRNKRFVTVKEAPYSIDIPPLIDMIEAPSALEALNLLNQGIVDIFIAPAERVADYLITTHGFTSVRKEGDFIGEIPLGFIVDPRDQEQTEALRTAVKELKRTGSLARIRDKWFSRDADGFNLAKYGRHIAATLLGITTLFIAFGLWNLSLKRRVARVARDLRQTEQRYRDLIESSPDMIFVVNEAGEILHANERARTSLHLGIPCTGLSVGSLVVPDERDEITVFLKKIFSDGCDRFEFRMNPQKGETMHVEIAGRIIQGPVQACLQACLFARNVTERNLLEEELIQSERLAIIGKMAAGVAHEINNPLGIIQYNAEDILYAEKMSDDAREGLVAISRNASRAADTITHMLDLASPKPMAKTLLNLEEAVQDSIALLGPRLKNTQVSLKSINPPLNMLGDSRAIQQVLVNLLLNALNSMQGEGTISITGQTTKEGIRLVVQDTGKGIPQKDLPRIFDPFFTSRNNGFGLGLFITRRIVEHHEGIIFAESEPGNGTRMFLEFPTHTNEENV